MSSPYLLQPIYKIEFYANNSGSFGTKRHTFGTGSGNYAQASSWNIKYGMTKAISSFEINIPDTGSDSNMLSLGNAFSDIDVFDYVVIWYGYTGSNLSFPSPFMFIGRIDTKKVSLSEDGYVRTFMGRDLGEVLYRNIQRRAFTGSAVDTYKQVLLNCGVSVDASSQPYIEGTETGSYFFVATKSGFDTIGDISALVSYDFYMDSGSNTTPRLRAFLQNSSYANEYFHEGENIFKYDLVRDIGEIKNDVYIFGQQLLSYNSGSYYPISKHEFTDNFTCYADTTFSEPFNTNRSFCPQWHGTLWPVTNYSGSGANAQYFKTYPLGYNAAHQIISFAWPFLASCLPELDTGSGFGLLNTLMSIRQSVFGGKVWANWTHGFYDMLFNNIGQVSGSGTIFTPSQSDRNSEASDYATLPTGTTELYLKDYIQTGSWYAITLLLDLVEANNIIANDLQSPRLPTGSFRTSPALMLNSGDSITLTYGQTWNAINAQMTNPLELSHPEIGTSGSDVHIKLKQINEFEQWYVVLGSNRTYNAQGDIVPTDYFACAVEAPELKCSDGIQGPNQCTVMTISLPIGPEFEGTSSPTLRGTHTGSYKWTRHGNPDWYNITYAGIMFEFKTPSRTDVPTARELWSIASGNGPFASTCQLGNDDITGMAYNVFIENMWFNTTFQGHKFDADSITQWGIRPSVQTNMRNVSNEMCEQEAEALISKYRNPITTIELETYAKPYPMGKMFTILLNSEPNLEGIPGKTAKSFTLIEHEVNWSGNQLLSRCTLTNLPGMRYPCLFTNFHFQPTLYSKGLWDYISPYLTTTVDTGPPKFN